MSEDVIELKQGKNLFNTLEMKFVCSIEQTKLKKAWLKR